MKYAVGMGSDAMTYLAYFMKICLGIQKLIEGDTQTTLVISYAYFYFLKIRKVGLCGVVVRVPGYRSRGPGFHSRRYQIF
jgi:hypothetical protein